MRRAIPDQIGFCTGFVDDDIQLAVAIYIQQAPAFGKRTPAAADYLNIALRQTPPQKLVAPGNERALL